MIILFSNNELGIKLLQSEYCSVYKNIISNNTNGIVLDGETAFIFIHHNQITDNEIGLWVDGSWGTIYSNNFINNEEHAYFSNSILFPFFLFHRQHWFKNYWDDWKVRIPKPIRGDWGIVIFIVTHPYIFGPFPTFEFDWHPAREPYDIPIPELS
ncbi:MAG: right-handed parallel beta-helix repeat-containing protein [Thermoplasmatales archaeon]|nr:right-handed parallel beta-helix repeat-containing protein [Thermoplasmatales archaeon]